MNLKRDFDTKVSGINVLITVRQNQLGDILSELLSAGEGSL